MLNAKMAHNVITVSILTVILLRVVRKIVLCQQNCGWPQSSMEIKYEFPK